MRMMPGGHRIRLVLHDGAVRARFAARAAELAATRGAGNEGVRIAFHGTRKRFERGIEDAGLVVPGASAGVTVANGALYGVGIYLSGDPNVTVHYAGPGGVIFMCAILCGAQRRLAGPAPNVPVSDLLDGARTTPSCSETPQTGCCRRVHRYSPCSQWTWRAAREHPRRGGNCGCPATDL